MVIFGAAGDLTKRKLIPALTIWPKRTCWRRSSPLWGCPNPMSNEEFTKKIVQDIKDYAGKDVDQKSADWFAQRLSYVTADFSDKSVYGKLKEYLEKVNRTTPRMKTISFIWRPRRIFFGRLSATCRGWLMKRTTSIGGG